MQTLLTRGLSAGSLFKVLFLGLLIPLLIFGIICGVLSLLGYSTVTFNEQYIYGIKGLLGGIALGVILPLILSVILWILISIGLWIVTRFHAIKLKIKE